LYVFNTVFTQMYVFNFAATPLLRMGKWLNSLLYRPKFGIVLKETLS